MDGDQIDRHAAPRARPRARVQELPLVRVGGPSATPQLRLAPTPTLPHSAETRAADAILARALIEDGTLSETDALATEATARELDLPLARILLTRGRVAETTLLNALAKVHNAPVLTLQDTCPDPRLAHIIPRDLALGAEAVPCHAEDGTILIATARPDLFDVVTEHGTGDARPGRALATRADILDAQRKLWGAALAREAETRAPVELSCRTWRPNRVLAAVIVITAVLLAAEALFPSQVALVAFGIAGLAFTANITLKAAAFFATLLNPNETGEAPRQPPDIAPHLLRPPVVSILVPMFQEPEIAARLITHLARMRYPAERLDILLLLEEDDTVTADAIAAASLPPNMRVLTVPEGHPRTKPRALNYALPFARGEIIGIYDAEDRPDPNQIAHIVRRYDEVSRDVACLQGRLDYYNTDHNLMARLFTVEYASWFRVLLPGVQRLGLFVPLGGTTLFLRRDALEEVGGWDAHNVTEDAELGLRLARAGYRAELVDTTTYEEATAAVGPWIRQRSRWLKGYIITWATAMRSPVALWRDLGTWRFMGLQAQMLTAVLGFFLAPLLWSLVVVPFGVPHPLDAYLSPQHFFWVGAYMMLSLVLSVAVSIHACRAAHLRRLRPLAPVVELYYTLGTFAAWIGAFELMARPFFWAKTRHGVYGGLAKPLADDDGGPGS
jgi:cellulose synthase/poly-beta-1,6-N-acetylglucosamine synthase-like glycosyltransferase